MCGICGGVIIPANSKTINIDTLARMTGQLLHRGPDSDGFYISPDHKTGLGFRRLSIIDLSGGNQPLSNEDGSKQIVFNGEIYNYQELRNTLERKGHLFRTNSDTETIIHAFEEYGENCVNYLNGMFAFAIWDEATKKLFIARDRLGKKPLYFWNGPFGFFFASEIKGLLQLPEMPREVDQQALVSYLRYQYIPEPHSILKDVNKLPPASILEYDSLQHNLVVSCYWEPSFTPKEKYNIHEAEEILLDELRNAVRRRLVSDVPLGALLSGGIDSSLVVALMAEALPQVKTFTIGFDETYFDERPYARSVAQRYATEHHELVVHPDMMDILPRLVKYLDEPMADPSVLPTFYVSQMARKYVTVVLNGDGGDENFGGYWHYRAALRAQQFGFLPDWLKIGIIGNSASLLNALGEKSYSPRILRLVEQKEQALCVLHEVRTTIFNEKQLQLFFSNELFGATKNYYEEVYDAQPQLKGLDAMLRADFLTLLPGKFLLKMDRMSMGNSLEARSPLLDYHLVEFVAKLPLQYKLSNIQNKVLLRKLAKRFIPWQLSARPKRGFAVPLVSWLYFRHKNDVQQILFNPNAKINKYLGGINTNLLFECAPNEREQNSLRIWSLLILELWLQEFLP